MRLPLPLTSSSHYSIRFQIYDEFRKFTFRTAIRPVVIYGGAPPVMQVGLGFGKVGVQGLRVWGQGGAVGQDWPMVIYDGAPSVMRVGLSEAWGISGYSGRCTSLHS